jgi:hypothetical protein
VEVEQVEQIPLLVVLHAVDLGELALIEGEGGHHDDVLVPPGVVDAIAAGGEPLLQRSEALGWMASTSGLRGGRGGDQRQEEEQSDETALFSHRQSA